MAEERHWAQDVYSILVYLGIDPHSFAVNYTDPETQGRAVIAVPESKVAIAVEGDRPDPLSENGWHVSRLPLAQLQALSNVFGSLGVVAFEHVRRRSRASMTKNGSKEEARLLDGILRAQLREPDRNFVIRRDNGSELTVPDFAWPDLRLAFFLDGLWWHVSKDDTAIIDAMKDNLKATALLEGNRTRAERDAENRSELAADGWRILSCTDRDVATDEGVAKQVDRIVRLMRSILKEQAALATVTPVTGETATNLPDLADLL